MAFRLEDHMARMSREIATGERDGVESVIVRAARTYPTDALDLWDAVTDPGRLSRWFLPVTGELRPGGRYHLEGDIDGTIEACVPPERLHFTWEYGGAVSWVLLRFTPETDGTRLELEHETRQAPVRTERFGPGGVGVGWDIGFMGLARHIEEPAAYPQPPESDGWSTSPEAMDFYRIASRSWARAAIDAGTPAEEATAAAEATRAFFSGETTPIAQEGG